MTDQATVNALKATKKIEKSAMTIRLNKLKLLYEQKQEAEGDDLAYEIYLSEKQRATLIDVYEQLEEAGEPAADTVYVSDMDELIFKAKRLLTRIEQAEKIRDARSSDGESQLGEGTSGGTPKVRAKLPQLQLPKFGGEVEEWPVFWSLYKDLVGDTDLPDGTKMAYLKASLESKAADCLMGMSVCATNYASAINRLKETFDRKDLIIQKHWRSLHGIQSAKEDSSDLRRVFNDVEAKLESLSALGALKEDDSSLSFVCQVIVSKFPLKIVEKWSEMEKQDNLLKQMRGFLKKQVEVLETASMMKEAASPFEAIEKNKPETRKERREDASKSKSTASALSSSTGRSGHNGGGYQGRVKLEDLPVSKRLDSVRQRGICTNCLRKGHFSKDCHARGRCDRCSKRHHALLHEAFGLKEQSQEEGGGKKGELKADMSSVGAALQKFQRDTVVMESVLAMAEGPQGKVKVRVFFDSGANRSYVHEAVAKRLGLAIEEKRNFTTGVFGGGQEVSVRELVTLKLSPIGAGKAVTLKVWTGNRLTLPIVPVDVEPWVKKKAVEVGCTEDYSSGDPKHVQVLLGSDVYWSVVSDEVSRLTDQLVLKHSKLGPFLHGKTKPDLQDKMNVAIATFVREEAIERSWSLEGVGISAEETMEFKLDPPIRGADGRYAVKLPWKNELRPKDNLEIVERRLDNVLKKMTPEQTERYDEYFRDLEGKDYLRVTDKEQGFYLPHRGVWKGEKLRVVYDGSARGPGGSPSINQLLHTGPNLLPNLVDVLLKFRVGKTALQGDIKEAFLQLALRKEDSQYVRILWKDGAFEFKRLPFGLNCGPYLLNASVRELYAETKEDHRMVVEALEGATYVDDLLPSIDSEDLGRDIIQTASNVFKSAGMEVKVWKSNKRELDSTIEEDPESKVLGLQWNRQEDTLAVNTVPRWVRGQEEVTRRIILVALSSVFDPLGLACCWVIKGRILFQKACTQRVGWDSLLPQELQGEFLQWFREGDSVRELRFPRWNGFDASKAEIHVFTDASCEAYAVTVYLVSKDPPGSCLVFSRSRVAPLKPKMSIPRLELMGALIGARAKSLIEKVFPNCSTTFWTDSQVVRYWLKAGASSLKTFESNRVKEINERCDDANWYYVPSSLNPADIATRGCQLDAIPSLWWYGPPFLLEEKDNWPADPGIEVVCVVRDDDNEPPLLLPEPCDLPFELKTPIRQTRRVLAWVLRFVRNLRHGNRDGDLGNRQTERVKERKKRKLYMEAKDLKDANDFLLRNGQMMEFAKEYELLRQGKSIPKNSRLSRLHCVFDEARKLIMVTPRYAHDRLVPLVSTKDRTFKWMIQEVHERIMHSGPNATVAEFLTRFHALKTKSAVKRSLKITCFACRRTRGNPFKAREGALPPFRTAPVRPFVHTGVDYLGPLILLDGSKAYVLLFTCAVVRALHLELTPSMNAEETEDAIKRFMARRGRPEAFYSDNAMSFVKVASGMLLEEITWKFIPPRAPWWGGFYERLVALVKSSLKSHLMFSRLNFVQLQTVLCEIEEAINRRPISAVSEDEDLPLTPNHFLVGGTRLSDVECSPKKIWKAQQEHRKCCWDSFLKTYIPRLRQWSQQESGECRQPRKGELVLLYEKTKPRLQWNLGRILEVHPHTCVLKTARGETTRHWKSIVPLEASEMEDGFGQDPPVLLDELPR